MARKKAQATVGQPEATVTAVKGFNRDWTCRGMQFAVGGTFTQPGAIETCANGLHACKHPLSVMEFYPPATSRYAEVICAGVVHDRDDGDTKIAAAKITVTVELSISDLVQRTLDYVWSRCAVEGKTATGYSGAASATGDSGAASATGAWGAASATGYRGAASAWHKTGIAIASGPFGSAAGVIGSTLVLRRFDACLENVTHVWAGIVGRDGIEPDTYYTLDENGLPVVAGKGGAS